MSLVMRLLPDNPVLTKEMRVRMRGSRAYWVLFGYLGFLMTILLFQYWSFQDHVHSSGSGASEASRIGGEMFMYILITQMFLVLFITPAITSGSLTIEREQRTMDMVTMTRMPRRSIIIGKIAAAISFTALLLVSSLPLVSICFMLGSVDPGLVFSTYMMMLLGSFLIGSMGLMWSSIAKTTTSAVMFTYATIFVAFVFGWIIWALNKTPFAGGSLPENVFRALGAPWFGDQWFGVKVPEGTGFAVMSMLCGVLLCAIAMSRLEMFPERKALLLRGLTIAVVAIQMLGVNLWWLTQWYNRSGTGIQAQVQPPIGALILTVGLLMMLIPTFVTGELKPYEARHLGKHLLWGWSPKGFTRGKLASGLPFMLVLTFVCLFIFALSFVFLGKAGDISHAARVGGGPTLINRAAVQAQQSFGAFGNPIPKIPMPANYASRIGDFPQAIVMIVAFVVGFSLFCVFLSLLFRNRWAAWFLAYLALLAILIVPEMSHMALLTNQQPNVLIHLYYLNPIEALYQMAAPDSYWDYHGQLSTGSASMWLSTSLAWLMIGGLSLLGSIPIIAHMRKNNMEIPYEEMVANA